MGLFIRILIGAVVAVLAAFVLVALQPPGAIMDGSSSAGGAAVAGAAAVQSSARGFIGVVVSDQVVDIAARGDGWIKDVRARLGDRLARGAVVATLDDRPLRNELAVAQAALRAARSEEEKAASQLEEARDRRERWQRVSSSGSVVSEEDLAANRYKETYAAQQLKVAQAGVAEQQARMASLERQIDDTVVTAPFAGVVAARYVDPGATVMRGAPLVRLVSTGDLWVRFAVPEEQATAGDMRGAVEVRIEELGLSIPGVIEKVAPEVDAASRMIIVEAKLSVSAELDEAILAGRVARVHMRP